MLFKLGVCLCVMQIGCLRCAPAARKLQDAASGPTDIYWTARLCSHLAYSGYRHQAGRGFVFNSARYKLQVKGGLRQGRSCKDAHAPDITDIAGHGQGNIKAPVGSPRHANKALRPATCLYPLLPAKGWRSAVVAAHLGHTDLTVIKRCVAYTLGDIKEQHVHASPVNKLVSVRKRVGRVESTT